VTGTTPVDGGDGEDGSDDEDDEGDDDDNGHGNDCDTDPSNPSGNDPPGQEEDCEEDESDDDGGSDNDGDGGDDDDNGHGNDCDTDSSNPGQSDPPGQEEDCGDDEESDDEGSGDDAAPTVTFGYENTYPGAVYLTPGTELPTGLFEPEERNDVHVNRTSDPVGEEGPSVVGLDSVGFEVQDTTRYGAGDGGLPSRFPAGSPDSVLNVTGLDGQQLVTWYLGDEAATASGSGTDDEDDDSDDEDDSRKAISFVAACPADGDIGTLDITVTETKDGGEPVAIEWTSDRPVETVVLKTGPSMENFDADGANSGTAAVGEGTAAGSGQTPSSPCPDGDGLKYEWDGGSFEEESSGDD
jgi:hypothetical protein